MVNRALIKGMKNMSKRIMQKLTNGQVVVYEKKIV
jgi:rRNA processing protein Krr1/Pno1